MSEVNKVFIEENNYFTRWRCITCGGQTDKDNAHPMIKNGDKDDFLCDQCLEAGEDGIRERLLRHAENLEEYAADLRRTASEQWEMPSMLQLRWYREKLDMFHYSFNADGAEESYKSLPKRFYKNEITVSEADLADAVNEINQARERGTQSERRKR